MFLRNTDVKIIYQTINSMRKYGKAASVSSSFGHNNNNNHKTSEFKRKPPEDLIRLALDSINISSTQDWDKVRQFALNHELNKRYISYSEHNIDGMIMASISRLNRLDLARSYLKYLEGNKIKPNLATIGRYLKMLYEDYNVTKYKLDEKEILSICDDIQKNNPILESRTLENMVLVLSLTKEWKKCIGIFEEIKKTSNASTLVYSALIAAAFRNKEEKLAWNLLNETVSLDKTPTSATFLSYLQTLKGQKKKENIIKNMEKLFVFFKETQIHCQEEVVNDIVQTLNIGQKTTVQFSGRCENCNEKLEKLELTDDEFAELKDVFFKNAILGKDVFIKTNPEEMKMFQAFVAQMGKYDVVLDGLNIAYSAGIHKGPQVFSKILRTVITHFVEQNKSVLMLGRAHMKRWPKYNWDYIKHNADIFLTQNISQDDPYLLYCALHSGKDTIIVTRDLMRSHKFLLKERKYKTLFDRWLSQRQYFLLHANNRNKAFFKIPPDFSAVTQKNGNVWHIPYVPELDKSLNEMYHETWLCLNCN